MRRIIHRVWAAKFYEQNAGILALVFFVMFGLVDPGNLWSFHAGLIVGTLSSTELLLLVSVVWALYAFRSVHFVLMALRRPENALLFDLAKVSPIKRLLSIGYAQLLVHLPVYGYAGLMVFVAVQTSLFIGLAIVLVTLASLLVLTCLGINRLITSGHVPSWSLPPLPFPRWKGPVPFVWFYLGWINHQHRLGWFLTKIFSGLAIILFLQIDSTPHDYRPAALGLWLAICGHSFLIAELHNLQETYLVFLRALPLTRAYRFFQLFLSYAVLLLPEMIMLAWSGLTPWDWFGLYVLAISTMMFLHNQMRLEEDAMDKHLRRVILTYLIGFGAILSGFLWIILPLALLGTLLLFWQHRTEGRAA